MQQPSSGPVEDLDDLTAAVARLEATADALDGRLSPTAGASGPVTAPGTSRA